MPSRRNVLTPEALSMMDTIARSGSFAAAAREMGKVPSALTYSVRQLEDALDVLLFDRSSRQAQLTPAGTELLVEGRRLLQEMDAVANRVHRVASGWETELSIVADDLISTTTLFEITEAFCQVKVEGSDAGPATRLRMGTAVLAGTWEALISGRADLVIGVAGEFANPGGIELRSMGHVRFVFCVAPHHPLARVQEPLTPEQLVQHRAVAVADTAQRLSPITVNLLPGQDVLTVHSLRAKLEALIRGLGCGYLPEPMVRSHLAAGRMVTRQTSREDFEVALNYAWRTERSALGGGKALQWWLGQLASPATQAALVERQAGLLPG